ncbi:MAG: phosphohistidine phosphatase SixA [Nitrospirae bacterium]|nr:phosphohistidine phosphatase SixA [Nitrospirota bacterium]
MYYPDMFLYLVRHAEAKSEEEDPSRGLTEKGVQDIRKVASFLGGGRVRVPGIFHSGKTRAMQTVQALADHLHPSEGISPTDGLAPMDDPRIWGECLSNQREDLMLVGHLPHLGRLSALLLCGNPESPIVTFETGGVVCLERGESGRWSMMWMIVPGIL